MASGPTASDNAQTGLTATPSDGTTAGTAAGALVIPSKMFFSQVSTCTDRNAADATGTLSANAGVSLPLAPFLYPKTYTITNNGTGTLLVWQPNTTSTIDGKTSAGTAGLATCAVLPGCTKELGCTSVTAAGLATWFTVRDSNNGKEPVKTITGTANSAPVLLAAESGLTLNLVGGNRANEITLPAAAAGLRYKFVYGSAAAAAGFDWKVSAAAAVLQGGMLTTSGAAGASVFGSATGSTHATFTHAAAGCKIGDTVEVTCTDGTNWVLWGMAAGTTAGLVLS